LVRDKVFETNWTSLEVSRLMESKVSPNAFSCETVESLDENQIEAVPRCICKNPAELSAIPQAALWSSMYTAAISQPYVSANRRSSAKTGPENRTRRTIFQFLRGPRHPSSICKWMGGRWGDGGTALSPSFLAKRTPALRPL
jgi:hypothetical protein